MEEFIYILLLVIWVAASLFKKSKAKQKQAASQPKAQEKQADPPQKEADLGELLEEFLGGGKKTSAPATVEAKEEISRKDERRQRRDRREEERRPIFSASEDLPRSIYGEADVGEETESMVEEYQEESGVKEDFEFSAEGKVETIEDLIQSHSRQDAMAQARAELEEEEGGRLADFDLRQAVVFSEILNRKYH